MLLFVLSAFLAAPKYFLANRSAFLMRLPCTSASRSSFLFLITIANGIAKNGNNNKDQNPVDLKKDWLDNTSPI